MEAFSPDRDTFLPVQIPVPENTNCCLYVDNNLLVLHSTNYILKFAMEQGGQLIKRSEVKSPSVNKWQNSQPVVDKANGLFFMIQNGQCLRISIETGTQGPNIA
jgi:hypothetical protein